MWEVFSFMPKSIKDQFLLRPLALYMFEHMSGMGHIRLVNLLNFGHIPGMRDGLGLVGGGLARLVGIGSHPRDDGFAGR